MNTKDGKKYMGIILAGIMVCAVFAAVMPAMVSAKDPTGASVDAGPTETWAGTASGSNASQGGYVTEINLTSNQQTGKWQGYYGNITGSIALKDSGGVQSMFNWDPTITGEVIATTLSSTPTWASTANVTTTERDHGTNGINAKWGWSSSSDDADQTFTATDCGVTIGGVTVTNSVGTANDAILPTGQNWKTVVVKNAASIDNKDDYMFVGIINDNGDSFKGGSDTCDYEMIVPSSGDTYYFYVELE